MRKLLFVLFILPLSFISCSSDDDSAGFDYDLEVLYGTWRITHIDVGSGYVNVTSTSSITPTYATFNPDGTYSGKGYFGNGSGTYKAEGKRITCYVSGSEYTHYDVISLTGDICELTMAMGSESINLRCAKQ